MARALLVLKSAADKERAMRWVAEAPTGTRLEFKGPVRTLPQNDLMWARLTEIATKKVWYGQKLKPEVWKDMFSASLRRAQVVPGIDPGTFVPTGLHTSDMDKEEMTALLDLIDAFAAENGITFNEEEAA